MEHLSIDEIIEFVSANELNSQSIKLAKKVNRHMRNCAHCYNKVRAFQLIFDEFMRIGNGGSNKRYLLKCAASNEKMNTKRIER